MLLIACQLRASRSFQFAVSSFHIRIAHTHAIWDAWRRGAVYSVCATACIRRFNCLKHFGVTRRQLSRRAPRAQLPGRRRQAAAERGTGGGEVGPLYPRERLDPDPSLPDRGNHLGYLWVPSATVVMPVHRDSLAPPPLERPSNAQFVCPTLRPSPVPVACEMAALLRKRFKIWISSRSAQSSMLGRTPRQSCRWASSGRSELSPRLLWKQIGARSASLP